MTNGDITLDKTTALENDTVTVTVAPAVGYQLKAGTLTYTPEGDSAQPISSNTFTMPAKNVVVSAEFETVYLVTVTDGTATPTNAAN